MRRFLGIVRIPSAQTPGQSGSVVLDSNRLRIFIDHDLVLDQVRAEVEISEGDKSFTITSGIEEFVFSPKDRADFSAWLDIQRGPVDRTDNAIPAERPSRTTGIAKESQPQHSRRCDTCGRWTADPAADFCPGCGKRLHASPEGALLVSLMQRVSQLERDWSTSRANAWQWRDVQPSERWKVFWGTLGRGLLVNLAFSLLILLIAWIGANCDRSRP
ncbi:MAG: hypothetical protein H0U53_10260 [Actinobacteria bacterium]|nr:hypothetical protein [Actinomycetota bacterium]